jgi:signal transduction histidine kinase
MGVQNQSMLGKGRTAGADSRFFSHLSASFLVLLFVGGLSQFHLAGLNGILVDGLFRAQVWGKPNPDIALIAYDDSAGRRHVGTLKMPADELVGVLNKLKGEQPKAVGLIGAINERDYSENDLRSLATALSQIPNSVVGYLDDDSLGNPPPNAFVNMVKYRPGYVSRDTFSYGADSVTRRVMIQIDGFPTLYDELARIDRGMRRDETFRGVKPQGRRPNTLQTSISWHARPGSYRTVSTGNVISGNFPAGFFRNKIVLIGSALSHKESDFILTPFSRESHSTPFLEGAAESLGTLISNEGIRKSGPLINLLLCAVLGFLTVNLVLFLSPGRGIIFMLATTTLLVVTAEALLVLFHFWIDLAHPLMTACVSYYVVVPYRLFSEYRFRWHYQEKSELMGQLEQLKSNFLSLITHDLTTPIARIQGSAEILLNESSNLTNKQKRSVSGIIHTTEDLSEYVETILDLARIESAEVPIQKASKDINSTIEAVIESKRFLAAEKNISLNALLEPIFSIKFDIKLIHRVISNLVENAIKYSPSDTRITISSKEDGNWIRVTVSDEGFGIAEAEQVKVFDKFYRCQNESTVQNKGTGLGLYLVKYFVELHRGFVELKSELGKGSVFTISLPT